MAFRSRDSKGRYIAVHGHRAGGTSRTYEAWRGMYKRCAPGSRWRVRYADRGITVCKAWAAFTVFLADMGECPAGLTLDRRDNNKGYSKANCRWVTRQVQQQNMRSNSNITHAGRTYCMAEWARQVGISRELLHWRLKRGWSISRALNF